MLFRFFCLHSVNYKIKIRARALNQSSLQFEGHHPHIYVRMEESPQRVCLISKCIGPIIIFIIAETNPMLTHKNMLFSLWPPKLTILNGRVVRIYELALDELDAERRLAWEWERKRRRYMVIRLVRRFGIYI